MSRYLLASRLENLLLRFKVLHDLGRRRWCRRQELESLIGTRHHFCQIIPPDRAFLRRMINLLCCFRNHAQPIRLNTEFHQDLSWWLEFVPSWAEVRFGFFFGFFRMPNMMPLPDFFVSYSSILVFLGPCGVSVATSQCCNSFLSWSLRMFGGTCGCAYRSSSTAIIPLLCLGIRSRCCSFTVCPWSHDHFRSPRVMFPVVRTRPRIRCLVSISKSSDASIHRPTPLPHQFHHPCCIACSV